MEKRNESNVTESEFSGKEDGGVGVIWSDSQTLGNCLEDGHNLPVIVKIGNQKSKHYGIGDQGPSYISDNSLMKIMKKMSLKTALIRFKVSNKRVSANRSVSESVLQFVDDSEESEGAVGEVLEGTDETSGVVRDSNGHVACDDIWRKRDEKNINSETDVTKNDQTLDVKSETFEVLVPLDYKKKVRIHSKIPMGKQYNNISQVIDDFPRFIEVEDDLFLRVDDATEDKLCPDVPRGTVLELYRVLAGSHPGERILECKYSSGEFAFRSDQNIICKAVPDKNLYTLQDIVDKIPLPQTFQFVDGEQGFAILDVCTGNITKEGNFPREIEIECVSNVNVFVAAAQIERDCRSEFATILIPAYNTFLQSIEVHLPNCPTIDKLENLTPSEADIENWVDTLFAKLSENKRLVCLLQLESSALERNISTGESNPPPLPPKVSGKVDATEPEQGNNPESDVLRQIVELHNNKESKKKAKCTIL